MFRTKAAVATAVLMTVLCGCANETPVVDVSGDCADVFQGQTCTWAKVQGQTVMEVGAVVPIASIENAPATDDDMSWPPHPAAVLNIPASVQQGSGLTQFTMYWEAGGHPPAAYMKPHFDFHFYTVPQEERAAIDCKDVSKPAALPTGYVLADVPLPPEMAKMIGTDTLFGICVPQMGMHALPAAEVDGSQPFSGDMVVGYWQGKPIFIEPMITKEMLMAKRSFELRIPAVPGLDGPHPTHFQAVWDDASQSYRFTFSGFTGASAA